MKETDYTHVQRDRCLRRIRIWLAIFIAGLVLSGLTAFPLVMESGWLVSRLHRGWIGPVAQWTGLLAWIERVDGALAATHANYPFLAYGTDWLAFAHLAIAVAFLGPLALQGKCAGLRSRGGWSIAVLVFLAKAVS